MKTIVFVRRVVVSRIYNQVFALKQTNKYKLILVCPAIDQHLWKFDKVFDKIICYNPLDLRNLGLRLDVKSSFPIYFMKYLINHYIEPKIMQISEQIRFLDILRQLKPDVCNCFGGDLRLTLQIMRNIKCPVILDIDTSGPVPGVEEKYKRDKYVFEHASGIIHRGVPEIEINYYKEHGYKITCPTLCFLDYCNREFFADNNIRKLSCEDGKYHIVMIGGGIPSHQNIIIIKKFIKGGVHVHLYPGVYSVISPVLFKELLQLNSTEKYFHLEDTVPFDKTPKDLAKYDFGALITASELISRDFPLIALKTGLSNRMLTYLEAGLPIIVSEPIERMRKIVEENKVGISMKFEEAERVHSILENYDYEELRKNVFKTREKLLIDNYVKDVDKFFETVIQQS